MAYLEALEAWRRTREPDRAAAVLEASDLAARIHPMANERWTDPVLFHTAWMATAESGGAEATPWLVLTLSKHLEADAMRRVGDGARIPARRWAERAAALLAHAPNPVVTRAALAVLRDAELRPHASMPETSVMDLYRPAFDLLHAGGDRDVASEVGAVLAQHRSRAASHALEVVSRELVAPLEDFLSTLGGREASGPRASAGLGEAALRDAVAADVDDDAPRLVYADWLTERGDALGEFIVLQCQLEKEPDPKKRAKLRSRVGSILLRYKALWLGDLGKVITNVEFRRGFLTSFAIGPNHVASADEWRRLASDPRLRTVESIEPGRGNKRNFATFVGSPEAMNLRVLHHVGAVESRAIAEGPPRRIRTLVVSKVPATKLLQELFTARGLPELARIEAGAVVADTFAKLRAQVERRPLPSLREVAASSRGTPTDLQASMGDLLAMPLEKITFRMRGPGLAFVVTGAPGARALDVTVDRPAGLYGPAAFLGFARGGFERVRVRVEEGVDTNLSVLREALPDATFEDAR